MGRGIGAVIPLEFKKRKFEYKEDSFREDFIKHYDKIDNAEESEFTFKIHEDFLLQHYKDFLISFYKTIEEDYLDYVTFSFQTQGLTIEELSSQITDMKSFFEVFDRNNRSGHEPRIYKGLYFVSCRSCSPLCSWVFYFGSYKVFFEEFLTFKHLENILSHAISNPLARLVRFAEIG